MSRSCSCAGNNPGRNAIVISFARALLNLWSIAAFCGALITPLSAQTAAEQSTGVEIPTYIVVRGKPVEIEQADQVLRAGSRWSLTGAAHVGLAGASFCPTICGSTFSTFDACLYAVQGDYVNAGISIVAAGAGLLSDAGAAKLVGLGIKSGAEATAASKLSKTADQIALKRFVNEATTGSSPNIYLSPGGTVVPTPRGMPSKSYQISPSQKGGGFRFTNRDDPNDVLRVMPGNPNSPNPAQQAPYTLQQRGGKAYDIFGNRVSPSDPGAHIPSYLFQYFPP
jgi:hypothetical protein